METIRDFLRRAMAVEALSAVPWKTIQLLKKWARFNASLKRPYDETQVIRRGIVLAHTDADGKRDNDAANAAWETYLDNPLSELDNQPKAFDEVFTDKDLAHYKDDATKTPSAGDLAEILDNCEE